MTSTRRANSAKSGRRLSADQQPVPDASLSAPVSGSSGLSDLMASEGDLDNLIGSLSNDSKTLVKILNLIISKQFKADLEVLKNEINSKDAIIDVMKNEIQELKSKVQELETNIDNAEQYERRDTVIISGPVLPPESRPENTVDVVKGVIRDHLKINLNDSEISVAHRIGPVNSQRPRPIIMKLVNRSMKYDLVGACVQLKPGLYINESLTPKRLNIFKKVLHIRKEHQDKFQQCHTKDGKIIIKLKNSTLRHTIVDDNSLMTFLDKYPLMKDTYLKSVAAV